MGEVAKSGPMVGWVDCVNVWVLRGLSESAYVGARDDGWGWSVRRHGYASPEASGWSACIEGARDAALARLDGRSLPPEPQPDPLVETPPHYQGAIECIDAIDAMVEGYSDKRAAYYAGQAMRYLWRVERKGKPVQDARKARWYVERLIAREEELGDA